MRKLLTGAIGAGAVFGVVLTPVAANAAAARVSALAVAGISTTRAAPDTDPATASTTMTFTVSSGELSITAPAAADFGTGAPGTTLSGHLGQVEVDDNRAADNETWTVTAAETNFINDNNAADIIPATDATYDPGDITTTGSITVTGTAITLSTLPQTVVTGADGTGDNIARWNPLITIALPSTAVSGGYTGTLTHSVS
jgi:hypothetical protein